MKWTGEAEGAVSKVPFFIRKRVKKRVEEEAERQGSSLVTLDHVKTCQQRFLKNMDAEVKGFQVEACFGPTGCPNAVVVSPDLVRKLEDYLESRKLRDFLKEKVQGPLKLHHEFRVSLSTCPNACSRPQIVDFGIIGALRPRSQRRTLHALRGLPWRPAGRGHRPGGVPAQAGNQFRPLSGLRPVPQGLSHRDLDGRRKRVTVSWWGESWDGIRNWGKNWPGFIPRRTC